MLKEILAQNPRDTLARYGLAMEYSNSGQVEDALSEFGSLLATNPDYAAGYFMAAQMLAREGREDEARKMLRDGNCRRPAHWEPARPIGDGGTAEGVGKVRKVLRVRGFKVAIFSDFS